MIDHSLVISPVGMFLFYLKQGFFLYVWPVLIGFLTIIGYQLLGRISMTGTTRWPVVFGFASAVSMVSLFGWMIMVRRMEMIPFYGCGVGLASAMMSRIYAVTMPVVVMKRWPGVKLKVLRVTWRGDAKGIEQLHEALRARSAAPQPGL